MSSVVRLIAVVATALVGLVLTLWFASQWWEKAFATRVSVEVSPDGCYRLERYTPYWVLPMSFDPARQPNKRWNPLEDWYGPWLMPEIPTFYRLYDNRSGTRLIQTDVYDLAFVRPGDALFTSEWYRNAVGSVGAVGVGDLDLPCSASTQ